MQTFNTKIISSEELITPKNLFEELPISKSAKEFVFNSRKEIEDILLSKSDKIILIVGPCSIHNISEAKEYALKLKELSSKVSDKFFIIIRAYFEKPRTVVGWQGLIVDPNLDNSFEIETGLRKAREFLLYLAEIKMPVAVEFLNPIVPQYISDLVSWVAIGARTVESQTHRQMVSGLSMPVGFKNNTSGDILVSINAIKSAKSSQNFIGVNELGKISKFKTSGNSFCNIVLRGGKDSQNFNELIINKVQEELTKNNLSKKIYVDCSHGNSNKVCSAQLSVFENVIDQIKNGNNNIVGLMIESNLEEGAQSIEDKPLKKGVSITDECIGWDDTQKIILNAYQKLIN